MYAGPYFFSENTENGYKLQTNEFFKLKEKINCVENIQFILIKSDKDAKKFFDGTVDVTCNTALDLNKFSYFSQLPNFSTGEDILVMLLSPGDKHHELSSDITSLISLAIDRNTISKNYHNQLSCFSSFLDFYYDKTSEGIINHPKNIQECINLDISYENYYPNYEILTQIAKQLSKYNINVTLHEDAYGHWTSHCHLRFEIRRLPHGSSIQIIRSELSKIRQSNKYHDCIKKIYSALFDKNYLRKHQFIFEKIDHFLRLNTTYIPLFRLPVGFLYNDKLRHETLFSIGNYITYRNNNENKT
ncbi:hypothetical protein CER18_03385 [Bartonella tribocorum]|uniref:Uncharacterized protein n=1 Tax=Bartonella tribocorum TaxID=85701 RepID=A0A2M6UTM3_9HYPH|nr:hypothetical protein CER18_03385 [Bartonella tribocorum]